MVTQSKLKELKQLEKERLGIYVVQLLTFIGLAYLAFYYPQLRHPEFSIIRSLLFLATSLLFVSIARMTILFLYIKRKRRNISYKDNFVLGINQFASILSLFAFIGAVFIFFRIDSRELFTSLSIFAVALTLIFKDYIANTINGMILLFSQQFSLNELVKIGAHKGKIVDITLKNIILKNDKEEHIYVPNNIILASDIVNYSKGRNDKVSVEFELAASHGDSPEDIENYLKEHLKNYQTFIKPGSIILIVLKITKDTIFYRLDLMMVRKNFELEDEIRNYINKKIFYLIQKQEY
ncbi:MAG: mechanosensitive ion channel family protein [Cytophagaceae bacterium]